MKTAAGITILGLATLLVLGVFTSCERQSPTGPSSQGPDPGESVPKPADMELTASKTADGFWERRSEYDWTIEKTADPTSIDICSGASGTITYLLSATRTLVSEFEAYGARGEVCVSNTGGTSTENLSLVDEIWHKIGEGSWQLLVSVTIDVSAKPILNPGESYCYPYEITFTPVEGAQYKNIVYVNDIGYRCETNIVHFSFPETAIVTEIDAEAEVTEIEYCPDGFTCTPSAPGPWYLYDSDVISFTKTVYNNSAMCDTYFDLDNDVTLEEMDTGQLRTDSATVSIYTCPCGEGCTLTIGYWKTHAGFHGKNADRVTQYLPIWLGTAMGTESIQVTTAAQAVEILSKELGHASNGITKLYAQLLGTKLNVTNGADESAVSGTIGDADAFLAAHGYHDWNSLTRSQKKIVLGWMKTLDHYNNGYIGPGHCD